MAEEATSPACWLASVFPFLLPYLGSVIPVRKGPGTLATFSVLITTRQDQRALKEPPETFPEGPLPQPIDDSTQQSWHLVSPQQIMNITLYYYSSIWPSPSAE